MKKEDLQNLINDDDLGLLDVKPKNSSAISTDERLIASFLEINNFFQENDREPCPGNGLQEHQLASRLKSIQDDSNKIKILLDYDEYNLLKAEKKDIRSIKDLFDDDDLGVLDTTDESLFRLENISKHIPRASAEFIARRKPCKDFQSYEHLFAECQSGLKEGKLRLRKLERHNQIYEGCFFVLGGILGFVDKVFRLEINEQKKLNGRLRLIFENGTESNMLLQSLIKSMQDYDGTLVLERSREIVKFNDAEDKRTGYIYIVRSLSDNPKIQSISNLYKIGFSSTPVEDRVKNVVDDPTFLMAQVSIVTTFECYNFNPQKLEQLLHNFFGSACLNIDIYDNRKQRFIPREWFIAPLEIIESAVNLIISGGILNYQYDTQKQEIVFK